MGLAQQDSMFQESSVENDATRQSHPLQPHTSPIDQSHSSAQDNRHSMNPTTTPTPALTKDATELYRALRLFKIANGLWLTRVLSIGYVNTVAVSRRLHWTLGVCQRRMFATAAVNALCLRSLKQRGSPPLESRESKHPPQTRRPQPLRPPSRRAGPRAVAAPSPAFSSRKVSQFSKFNLGTCI